jgi:hypothetical protein
LIGIGLVYVTFAIELRQAELVAVCGLERSF